MRLRLDIRVDIWKASRNASLALSPHVSKNRQGIERVQEEGQAKNATPTV